MLLACYTCTSHLPLKPHFSYHCLTQYMPTEDEPEKSFSSHRPQEIFHPPSSSKQGEQGYIMQGFTQPNLEKLQAQKMHRFSGQPFPMLHSSVSEKGFPYTYLEPPISIQVHCISSFLHNTEKPDSSLPDNVLIGTGRLPLRYTPAENVSYPGYTGPGTFTFSGISPISCSPSPPNLTIQKDFIFFGAKEKKALLHIFLLLPCKYTSTEKVSQQEHAQTLPC